MTPLKAGRDYIGVSVGAIVFDAQGRVFLSQRGPRATNERGCWEFPGGKVSWGETLQAAVVREFEEEHGMHIELTALLAVDNHILPEEGQHWVATTYLARWVSGEPVIREPEKCTALGWFTWDTLPQPLSKITHMNVEAYLKRIEYP